MFHATPREKHVPRDAALVFPVTAQPHPDADNLSNGVLGSDEKEVLLAPLQRLVVVALEFVRQTAVYGSCEMKGVCGMCCLEVQYTSHTVL